MKAKKILDSIQSGIVKNKIQSLQNGDLKIFLENYSDLYVEYKGLSPEERNELMKEVKKSRPVIGKNLEETFLKDLSLES